VHSLGHVTTGETHSFVNGALAICTCQVGAELV
jgi:hypothetical protein